MGPRLAVLLAFSTASAARAQVPIELGFEWSGSVGFFATGAPMAEDGPDADGTMADRLAQPAPVDVGAADVPAAAEPLAAFVYWSGTVADNDCAQQGETIDRELTLTVPGGAATEVAADECHCAPAVASYDIQVCRADVLDLVSGAGGALRGTWIADDFAARITNAATDNASFTLVLVYRDPGAVTRHILLYDGVEEHASSSTTLSLDGFEVDDPPGGTLTYTVLDGDVGGTGTEEVEVRGLPGGAPLLLFDAVNPVDNPFNHTINTTEPDQTEAIGVDVDSFDVGAALAAGDTAVDVTFRAGTDKVWVAWAVVAVDVYQPVFELRSTKSWELADDADGDGVPSVGDTVRWTIHLENTGTTGGTVTVTDPIPDAAESWRLIDDGGGTDQSTDDDLIVEDVVVPEGQSRDVVFEVVLGEVADGTLVGNVAEYSDPPEGGAGGELVSPDLPVRRDGDGDGVHDLDDDCPEDPDPGQLDTDGDGRGDVCDACPLDDPDDHDGDGVCDSDDLCPDDADPGQGDRDGDGAGDACDDCPDDDPDDRDGDGVCDSDDVCPDDADPGQDDRDGDGAGDACDDCPDDPGDDGDGDGLCDSDDLCPEVPDPGQEDEDGDGAGDACDGCPDDPEDDRDGDGVCDGDDVCPDVADEEQADRDGDGVGDECDGCPDDPEDDRDGDGVCDGDDVCPDVAGEEQADRDGDGVGDECDGCPDDPDPAQEDRDGDGHGDACDEGGRLRPPGPDADGGAEPDGAAPGDDAGDTDGDGDVRPGCACTAARRSSFPGWPGLLIVAAAAARARTRLRRAGKPS